MREIKEFIWVLVDSGNEMNMIIFGLPYTKNMD